MFYSDRFPKLYITSKFKTLGLTTLSGFHCNSICTERLCVCVCVCVCVCMHACVRACGIASYGALFQRIFVCTAELWCSCVWHYLCMCFLRISKEADKSSLLLLSVCLSERSGSDCIVITKIFFDFITQRFNLRPSSKCTVHTSYRVYIPTVSMMQYTILYSAHMMQYTCIVQCTQVTEFMWR